MTTCNLFSANENYKNKLIIGSNGLKFIDYSDLENHYDMLYILFDDMSSIDKCMTTYGNGSYFGFKIKAKQMDSINDVYKDYNINIQTRQQADEVYKLISDGFNESCKKKDARIGIKNI